MNLSYNPKSGHIKREGAVVGKIDPEGLTAVLYVPGADRPLAAKTLPALLAKIKKALEKTHFTGEK